MSLDIRDGNRVFKADEAELRQEWDIPGDQRLVARSSDGSVREIGSGSSVDVSSDTLEMVPVVKQGA
jgi:hypothetical protein